MAHEGYTVKLNRKTTDFNHYIPSQTNQYFSSSTERVFRAHIVYIERVF